MEVMIRDDVSGKRVPHEVSETATAGELLDEACTLFGREVLDSALEVDGAVVCTGVVEGVSGGEASVGSLGVHADSSLVLCRSRDRVLAMVAEWDDESVFEGDSLPLWGWDDEAVALTALEAIEEKSNLFHSGSFAFKRVSERLRGSRSFMLDAAKRGVAALEYASLELRSDKVLVSACVAIDGSCLEYASDSLKADKEVVMAAVANHRCGLKFASNSLRADNEVVLAAVANNGWSLEYASDSLKADKEVVMAAVANDGWSLRFASDSLRADKEVVLAAVEAGTKTWLANDILEYASDNLRADREVVMAAVARDRDSLQYASAELQAELRPARGAE